MVGLKHLVYRGLKRKESVEEVVAGGRCGDGRGRGKERGRGRLVGRGLEESDEEAEDVLLKELPAGPGLMKACFAGGSYWLMEATFGCVEGVITTAVGYCTVAKDICHSETEDGASRNLVAVLITYDPQEVTYQTLLQTFWHSHDPTGRSFEGGDNDSCRSVIFYYTGSQRRTAHQLRVRHQMKLKKRLVTKLMPATKFMYAEPCYQKFALQSQQQQLFQSLEMRSLRQLVESSLACRLNGYMGRWKGMPTSAVKSPSISAEMREQSLDPVVGVSEELFDLPPSVL